MSRKHQSHNAGQPDIARIDRRRFLTLLGGAGALGAVGCSSRIDSVPDVASGAAPAVAESVSVVEQRAFVPNATRTLVVIELQGGNDGLAMLRPTDAASDGVLQTLRPDLLGDRDDDWIDAGDGYAWSSNLAGIAERGIAGIVGIGSEDPDFSHFEMEQRWWRGESSERSRLSTGFFGRLCDQLDDGAPVTGLSMAGGPTPALLSEKAVTVGFNDPGGNWMFRADDPWIAMFHQTVAAMAEPSASDHLSFDDARHGLGAMTRFADSIGMIEQVDNAEYPWTDLAQQLKFAAEVMAADVGVRVIHTAIGGFDTHAEQSWRHPQLMLEVDEAVSAFFNDLDNRGLSESTLVATTSEFGRRVEQNDGGTDHGGASTMVLCGPGTTGIHAEAPRLNSLDDGNLVATARFEDYYATLAEEWFGVPADLVLPSGGTVIDGVL